MLSSNGKAKARVARAGVAGQGPLCVTKRAKRAKSQESESFVLRTYIVDKMGVKKLHIFF